MIVRMNNHTNEKTWKTVFQWESLNFYEGVDDDNDDNKNSTTPKLLKCQGRPIESSPKAAFEHHTLGDLLPFDRHYWCVETTEDLKRCVIDHHCQEESPSTNENESDKGNSMLVGARPELDSFS